MRITLTAFVALLALSGSALVAQTVDTRVRITGVRVFDVAGIIHVDAGQVTGSNIVSVGDEFVQAKFGNPAQTMSIPRAGHPFVATAVRIDPDTLTVYLGDPTERLVIPFDAIGRIEAMEKRSPPHHRVLWTVLSGIGTFYGTTAIAISHCFWSPCSDGWAVFVVGTTAAVTAGTAAALDNERWVPISPADLSTRLASASQAGQP
jgi:hypothetical protein